MTLLKDLYGFSFYDRLANVMSQCFTAFDRDRFITAVLPPGFEQLELKERMRHTTEVLHAFVPGDYKEAVIVLKQFIGKLRENGFGEDKLEMMFLPDFLEVYGLDDFETSVEALEVFTQYVSCEFAVRPFILRYGQRMLDEMFRWSAHPNWRVRRLASEGSRPRLPWAMAVPFLKKDPSPLLPILENLKEDPSESVRRSVANNLNDIAKDHPELVIEIARKWKGMSKETDAIIKHGCRTLLKQGHVRILKEYGLDSKGLEISDFKVLNPKVQIGGDLEFSFVLHNRNQAAKLVRLEYGIYYRKAKGNLARKVFKISERLFDAERATEIHRKQSFRLITTRRYYTGEHKISLIINGEEKATAVFEITE